MAVEGSRPPQIAYALSAAGGGFGGALIAILVAKILMGPCCCNDYDKRAANAVVDPAEQEVMMARRH